MKSVAIKKVGILSFKYVVSKAIVIELNRMVPMIPTLKAEDFVIKRRKETGTFSIPLS